MIYSKDYQYISKRTRQIWANVWMLLTPVILFLMMEHINNPYGNLNIGLKYWIINVAILEIIFIFFYYICFPYRITVIIFYGIVNQIKYHFLNNLLCPGNYQMLS